MAREFGPKSYKPEDVGFVANGNQPSGLPWSAVQTMFAKNILLEASDNPSTIEDLSMALGVAAPYMEEQVDSLVKATLLKNIGGKYVTNFPIVSKETQDKAYNIKAEASPKRAELIDRIASDLIPEIRKRFVRSDRITDDGIKWWAVCECSNAAEMTIDPYNSGEVPARENGERWSFTGFERTELQTPFVSNNGFGFNHGSGLSAFVPHEYNVAGYWIDLGLHRAAITTVIGLIRNGRTYDSLSEAEKKFVDELKMLVHVGEDGRLVPDVLWIESDNGNEICFELFRSHPLFKEIIKLDKDLYDKVLKIVRADSNSLVKEQLYGVTGTMCHMRGMTVREEVNAGRLKLPEDPFNSVCTLAFYCNTND